MLGLPCLHVGGSVRTGVPDPQAVVETVARDGATAIFLSPHLWRQVAELDDLESARPVERSPLRVRRRPGADRGARAAARRLRRRLHRRLRTDRGGVRVDAPAARGHPPEGRARRACRARTTAFACSPGRRRGVARRDGRARAGGPDRDARLLAAARRDGRGASRRLAPHRRPGAVRRGGLPLHRRAQQGHDRVGGGEDLPRRGRARPPRAPGDRRGRRDRHPGRAARRDGRRRRDASGRRGARRADERRRVLRRAHRRVQAPDAGVPHRHAAAERRAGRCRRRSSARPTGCRREAHAASTTAASSTSAASSSGATTTGKAGEPLLLLGGPSVGHFHFDFVRPYLADYRLVTWEPRGLRPVGPRRPVLGRRLGERPRAAARRARDRARARVGQRVLVVHRLRLRRRVRRSGSGRSSPTPTSGPAIPSRATRPPGTRTARSSPRTARAARAPRSSRASTP